MINVNEQITNLEVGGSNWNNYRLKSSYKCSYTV